MTNAELYYAAISSAHWYNLKDRVRVRCRGKCEYCFLRPMSELHHIHYSTLGHEAKSDVMGLCHACHRVIHNGGSIMVKEGSLRDLGFRGKNSGCPIWLAYLASKNEDRRDVLIRSSDNEVIASASEVADMDRAYVRKRHRDGAGKGENSYRKHHLFRHAAGGQIGVLNLKGGTGLIVDMHAGDGEGVDLPQADMFDPAVSNTTPAIAIDLASRCRPRGEVVLCENNKTRRQNLTTIFGHAAQVIGNHRKVLELPLEKFAWVIVFNDPCGHGQHGIDVMLEICRRVPRSDFLIIVNESSLRRHLAVAPDGNDQASNAALVQGSRAAVEQYRWMFDSDMNITSLQWRDRLGKKQIARARHLVANRAFHGRLLVVSNYLANLSDKQFERFTW